MQKATYNRSKVTGRWLGYLLVPLLFALCYSSAQAFTVNVVDQDGAPVAGFKWLLEEDNTHPPEPGVHKVPDADVNNNTLSLSIHRSHAPVVAEGVEATASSTAIIPPAPGRYFVSVLPFGDRSFCEGTYDMGGGPIDTNSQSALTVYVRQQPIPTAQMSVKVFEDLKPLNNFPDPTEVGLPNFTVTIGDQGGDISKDAWNNTLGTTYVRDENGPVIDPTTCAPTILQVGSGDFVTDANGEVFIKNLVPNKYAVQVEPPQGETGWLQTTTIEGTHTIDAWVRPNEPQFSTIVQPGVPLWHIYAGYVKEMSEPPAGTGGTTITGQVRKAHLSRPPLLDIFPGPPPEGEAVGERCIVGLHDLSLAVSETFFVGKCEDETGNFTIPGVPAGTYQLVVWDVSLLHIISFQTVIADGVTDFDMGPVSTPMWFGIQEHNVLFGKPGQPGAGIPEQNVNLRFRDGTIYSAFPTDTSGFVPFQALFPFFHWLVAEVDFTSRKATGLRVTNDLGGEIPGLENADGKRNPATWDTDGPNLTEAFQIFAGQNQKFEWFKEPYGFNENGGISGTVTYATTRAEDDPRYAAVEPWEPGVPRVQVTLYGDVWCNSDPTRTTPAIYPICPEATPGEIGDDIPDDRLKNNGTSFVTPGRVSYADVDNYPLNWAPANCATGGQTCSPGPEDVDHNSNGNFNLGDALSVTWTDSWDDNLPENCDPGTATPVEVHGMVVPIQQCAEGLRTFNQTVPGVFDGGFAFGPEISCSDMAGNNTVCDDVTEIGADGLRYLKANTYIVQTATPPGYELLKEEDRNVDFGLTSIPAIPPPKCVGEVRPVPDYFSFLTVNSDGYAPLLPGVADDADAAAPFAGDLRPLCDMKKVDMGSGQNTAAEFHLFTNVPKAARAVGLLGDDLANELAPNKPQFSEKYAPPWINIAVFDYTGQHIFHTYSDEFGQYNWLAPSTYAIDVPSPSGVGPKMLQFCLNYPFLPDGTEDPRHRPQYSTMCYPFNFEPGRTTYLDTPILRQAAFVGPLQQTVDCQPADQTPAIKDVLNRPNNAAEPAILRVGQNTRISSMGRVMVPNPDFPGDSVIPGVPDDPPTEPEFIERDYRFGPEPTVYGTTPGSPGSVCIGNYCFSADKGEVKNWGQNNIVLNLDFTELSNAQAAGLETGQLVVTNTAGNSTPVGLTVTVDYQDGSIGNIVRVGTGQAIKTIQEGIDAASDGDLILVDPGVYAELPILYKRVALQGAGAGSTSIQAAHYAFGPALINPLVTWREKVAELAGAGDLGLLAEQLVVFNGLMPEFLFSDGEGPGIFVSPTAGRFAAGGARIDGFNISTADIGGAIYVNAYGDGLQISNNRVSANAGNLGGGIRIGNPTEPPFAVGSIAVETSPNPNINIHHNHIYQNGSKSVGGGAAIFQGADGYTVADNFICGNLSRSGGGGFTHRGLSNDGWITDNTIAFNEVFQGGQPGPGLGAVGGGGGGIEIAGVPGDPLVADGLSEGTGDVTIRDNLIQGNLGGSADGGGIALRSINGQEVVGTGINNWHRVRVQDNVIVNNVTGSGGAGISLQDAARAVIQYNTIAHNDSTATSIFAGIGTPPTTPQPAGIVSRAHSAALAAASGDTYSIPARGRGGNNGWFRYNNFIENRSWFYTGTELQPADGAAPPAPVNWDFGVVGTPEPECLRPRFSVITALQYQDDPSRCDYGAGNDGNGVGTSSIFTDSYVNNLVTASAADEGGNFVQVLYTPLGLTGDYTDNQATSGPRP